MSRMTNYLIETLRAKQYAADISELIVFITNSCNLNCRHCFYKAGLRRPLEVIKLTEYEKFIGSIRKPLDKVILTGGEPFLEPKLVDITKIFSEKNNPRQIIIPTNGLDVDSIVIRMQEILTFYSGRLLVLVSLDGLETYHNQLRGHEKAFSSAVSTLKRLRALAKTVNNFSVGVNMTVSQENIDQVELLADFVNDELGVVHNFELLRVGNYLQNQPINPEIGTDNNPKEIMLRVPDDQALAALNKELDFLLFRNTAVMKDLSRLMRLFYYAAKSMQEFYFPRKILSEKKPVKFCKAGRSSAVLYPNGDFAFCELTEPVANLRDYDFSFFKLWNDEAIRTKAATMLQCYCTHGCFVPQSFIYYGDLRMQFIKQAIKYCSYRIQRKNDN